MKCPKIGWILIFMASIFNYLEFIRFAKSDLRSAQLCPSLFICLSVGRQPDRVSDASRHTVTDYLVSKIKKSKITISEWHDLLTSISQTLSGKKATLLASRYLFD
jgi:hypothetical protein